MKTLAVVGSRRDEWRDPEKVAEFVAEYLWDTADCLVISGDSPAGGVDQWVRETCEQREIPFTPYPPDFKTHGSPAAFFVRNQQIVDAADEVVVIWNGLSSGSQDVIKRTLKARKHLEVIFP
jgi:molybdopterin biosynthesis enzyme